MSVDTNTTRMSETPPDGIAQAEKLRRALADSITRDEDLSLTRAQFDRLGVEDYRREFKKYITTRYFRKLLKRTKDRDGGAKNWERLEIYLPGRLKRKERAAPALVAPKQFRGLQELIQNFKDPDNPTPSEKDIIWLKAIRLYQTIESPKPKKVKRALLDFLFLKAPTLSKTRRGLQASFSRKAKAIEANQGNPIAIVDGRARNRLREGKLELQFYELKSKLS